jgi:uncharacterized membrane protein YfcA
MHTADASLVAWLMVGSIFGVVVGSRVAVKIAPPWLRRAILLLVTTAGLGLLYGI